MLAKTTKTILVADDEQGIVMLLQALCEEWGYESIPAVNGREAVDAAMKFLPDLIVLDGSMPLKDGFEATRDLKANESTAHIPVIMLTGLQTREDRLRGIAAGANDFLTKPVDREEFGLRIKNNLKIKEYHDFMQHHAAILEQQVKERTEGIRAALEKLEVANDLIARGYIDTIYRLAVVSEFKDEDTGRHIKRIGRFARDLAMYMGLGEEFSDSIYHASMMHDIGKVGIPDSVMLKAGPLSQDEWNKMKSHTETGALVLAGSNSPYLIMAEQIARSHHERWDGSGYPQGLSGDTIPLAARITNIVDQYDALRTSRSYKPAFDHTKAMTIISQGDGRTQASHFDPCILEVFVANGQRFKAAYDAWSAEAGGE